MGADRTVWGTSRLSSGTVTYRIGQRGRTEVLAWAWGDGAAEFLDQIPHMLCVDEDVADFRPSHPLIAEAHRRHPDLRMLRTGRVFESLVPAILEQKVHGIAAWRSWRKLVLEFGSPAPGPAPAGLRVPPDAHTWRRIPSWTFHRANVDPQRARTIVAAAQLADKLEAATSEAGLRIVPGIGVWTAAETAQRVFGDSDALSVGDFHLAAMVGWTLEGRPFDDAEMVEYLKPLQPHRHRAVRLLQAAGFAYKPKFGPRTPVTDHSRI